MHYNTRESTSEPARTETRQKELVPPGQAVWIKFVGTHKEFDRDGLAVEDVLESIVNANAIKKTLRSRSSGRVRPKELLYVIESPNYSGVWIYTKGTIRRKGGEEVFYVLVSSKLSQ